MSAYLEEHPWYEAVFISLAVLAVVKAGIAQLSLPTASEFVILTGLGLFKASLVAVFFMHLKFESWKLISFVMTPVICTVLLIGYVLVDASFGPWNVILPVVGFVILMGLGIGYVAWSRIVQKS